MSTVGSRVSYALLMAAGMTLAAPGPVFATQAHGDPEGLYVHQMSHLFLAYSMGLLIYWLRRRGLVLTGGWRNLQYSALFFIFWTIDAFTVHLMDEQYPIIQVARRDDWMLQIDSIPDVDWIKGLYYLVKLDHLFCVPALFLLYLGLKQLLKRHPADEVPAGP
ncbi:MULTISPECIES: hypothetical protein [Desulfococcus]|uniref:Uncharacterized protein n=1 Tax=Desulfococcus multivorans DSM 2059 TaxID=1121405 RepID=S7V8H1_DESML|nr:hypothetical protein [Desulfococcus multivorans]AOY58843.1 conserved uncharacterized protein [Desulfococcus multivorans]AQV02980.2 hypothetical protein B2D07_10340 [Desulfococcus multivorans]EPR42969.1 hypothetical protein dsmv_0050 [Desulfococcus multivorans DSM 2059]SJZ51509.1 hypothetical protein SAMN02745446_00769 [Desulfococcus multivorans DSM 2059]